MIVSSLRSPFSAAIRTSTARACIYQNKKGLKISTKEAIHKDRSDIPIFSYSIIGGLLVTTAGGAAYLFDELGGTEGLKRSGFFYSYAIPRYIEYRWYMWRHARDEEWDELDRRTSGEGLRIILELKGFYIKCGQMVASNIGNAFPRIWQDTMSILQDQVPSQDISVIKEIINMEIDFDKTFATFDPVPIGAASIGQVHRATLNNRERTPVVVKVRYPDVERLLKGDVRTIKTFARVAQPVHVPALEEIEKQFLTEFDYKKEAEQLETVRKNLLKAGLEKHESSDRPSCWIPRAFREYCTTRVLVMEELPGQKLVDALREDLEKWTEQSGTQMEEMLAQSSTELSSDCHGTSRAKFDTMIKFLDGQRRFANAMDSVYNWVVASWVPGTKKFDYRDKSALPLNHAKLIDDLVYIHGHEILVDGYFNGDPHPGNILLCRTSDGSPQLGLIDYGQVKRLKKKDRHLFARLVIALDDNNKEEVVELMKEAGFSSKKMDPNIIYLWAKAGYDEDNREITRGMHIQLFLEELDNEDPIVRLPQQFIMVGRASLILRGLAHALNQSRSMAKCWRPIAERVLKEDI